MKKIYLALIPAAALVLTACGAKSEASREQISKGQDQAKEMLRQLNEDSKTAPTAEATVPQAETPDTLSGK